jgi:hypothetical protein
MGQVLQWNELCSKVDVNLVISFSFNATTSQSVAAPLQLLHTKG